MRPGSFYRLAAASPGFHEKVLEALGSRGNKAGARGRGVRSADVPGFLVAQLLGAAAATLLFRWLVPALPDRAPDLLVPHHEQPEEA
jgi:hypothetical protein